MYRQQLRTAAKRDVEAHPEMAEAFKASGFNEHEVQNKVHYVCNAEIERKESTLGFELDRKMCGAHKNTKYRIRSKRIHILFYKDVKN